jgi:hypothetical protein
MRSISCPASGSNSCVSRELVTGLRSWVLLKGFAVNTEVWKNRKAISDTLESNIPQHCIGDIPHENPSDLENTFPLIRRPDGTASRVVDRSQHFGHAAEMTTNLTRQLHLNSLRTAYSPSVNAKEEINWPTPGTLLERFVEPLVTRISGAPDFVLETLVYVILGVRLDDKVPCLSIISTLSLSSHLGDLQKEALYQSLRDCTLSAQS